MTIPRKLKVAVDGVELGEQLLAVRYGLHDVARGWEGVDGSVDEFI